MQRNEKNVAPLVGAWIEIPNLSLEVMQRLVAPLVGAWIEILKYLYFLVTYRSLPLWERGLK